MRYLIKQPSVLMAQPTDKNPLLAAFERLHKGLVRMATGLTGNTDDAKDALQDAFVKLWNKSDGLQNRDEAAALLTVAVRNLSIDRVRRRQASPEVEWDDHCDDTSPEPTDENEVEEKYREVMQIVAERLTPLQQEILHLRDGENMPYDEIAQRLDMQSTAVRMQLSRARKIVRDLYHEHHAR